MTFGLGWGGVPFEPGRSKVFLLKAFVSAVDKDVLHFVVNSSLAICIGLRAAKGRSEVGLGSVDRGGSCWW